MSRLRTLPAGLAVLLGLAACSEDPLPDGPNVLLITVDSLRADRLGCYGYGRDTSPRLDALAEEAVLFERAYAHAPFTPPSHASLLTSLHVPSHGVLAWEEELDPEARTLGHRFGDAGYRTGAFHNHPGLVRSDVTRGFDEVQVRYFEPAEETSDAFLDWIGESERPFAAWVHYWDVHRPYGYRDWTPDYLRDHVDREPLTFPYEETRFGEGAHRHVGRTESYYNLTPADRGRERVVGGETRVLGEDDFRYVSDRYDGGVWYVDRALGELLDALAERGLLEDTLIVVTADHGESLTEREACFFTHDPFLFEETLRVPLVVRFPGARWGGRRVRPLARGIDVLPTLMEVCGLDPDDALQGRSLVPAIEGEVPAEVWHFAQTQSRSGKETDARAEADGWVEERRVLTDGKVKLLRDHTADRWMLFDLETDPHETEDRSADPAWGGRLAELRERMASYRAQLSNAAGGAVELSEEERRLLEGMGYVEPSAGGSGETP